MTNPDGPSLPTRRHLLAGAALSALVRGARAQAFPSKLLLRVIAAGFRRRHGRTWIARLVARSIWPATWGSPRSSNPRPVQPARWR